MAMFMFLYIFLKYILYYSQWCDPFSNQRTNGGASEVFLNMVVPHWALLGKHGLNVEDFYVNTIGRGQNRVFDQEPRKNGLFP